MTSMFRVTSLWAVFFAILWQGVFGLSATHKADLRSASGKQPAKATFEVASSGLLRKEKPHIKATQPEDAPEATKEEEAQEEKMGEADEEPADEEAAEAGDAPAAGATEETPEQTQAKLEAAHAETEAEGAEEEAKIATADAKASAGAAKVDEEAEEAKGEAEAAEADAATAGAEAVPETATVASEVKKADAEAEEAGAEAGAAEEKADGAAAPATATPGAGANANANANADETDAESKAAHAEAEAEEAKEGADTTKEEEEGHAPAAVVDADAKTVDTEADVAEAEAKEAADEVKPESAKVVAEVAKTDAEAEAAETEATAAKTAADGAAATATSTGGAGGEAHELSAWSTHPWSDCVSICGSGFQTRRHSCRSLWTGDEVDHAECHGHPAPERAKKCNCEETTCREMECPGGIRTDISESPDEVDEVAEKYASIGCFALGATDPGVGTAADLRDMACKDWKSTAEHCHSGLPFYRMHADEVSPSMCYEWCISKGLDIFGIVQGKECRCGASRLDTAAWGHEAPREKLLPPRQWEGPIDSMHCDIMLFRYKGNYIDGAIPEHLIDLVDTDEAYVFAVATGKDPPPSDAETHATEESTHLKPNEDSLPETLKTHDAIPDATMHGVTAEALMEHKKLIDLVGFDLTGKHGERTPNFERNCGEHAEVLEYPSQEPAHSRCGPLVWQQRTPDPDKLWENHRVVPWAFAKNMDIGRKNAMRDGLHAFSAGTCIRFKEYENAAAIPLDVRPFFHVSAWDLNSCGVTEVGMPFCGTFKEYHSPDWCASWVNMGWCSSSEQLGSIVHEIGHILGMHHTVKRPDAQAEKDGHGPFITVKQQNLLMPSQYTVAADDYTGSANDGAGDPEEGFAHYDFESIMHYPDYVWGGWRHGWLKQFDTIPPSKGILTGQRNALSEGDIKKLNDMYQCMPFVEEVDEAHHEAGDAPTAGTTEETPEQAQEEEAQEEKMGEADEEPADEEAAEEEKAESEAKEEEAESEADKAADQVEKEDEEEDEEETTHGEETLLRSRKAQVRTTRG